MTEIMISIRPQWCSKILSGEKTVELRKTRPNELPVKCYVYCTKSEKMLLVGNSEQYLYQCNGKVLGEFVCDKIYDVNPNVTNNAVVSYSCGWLSGQEKHCMNFYDIRSYLGKRSGYFWRISDLVVYDKPKEIGDFIHPCPCHGRKNCHLKAECGKTPDSCNGLVPLEYPFQGWGLVTLP